MSESTSDWGERLIRILLERTGDGDPEATRRTLLKLMDLLEAVPAERPRPLEASSVNANGGYRWDHDLIERRVRPGASVLDLGCGSGTLLARLIRSKKVRGQGIERDMEKVLQCVANGVPVFQTNLDEGLAGFPDESFDYVVLEETVQTLYRPHVVLSEMLRVGRQGIISFPNFGHWQVRLDLALNGRMPVTGALPYSWHDSPNIHHLTLHDFEDWMAAQGIGIVQGHALSEGQVRPLRPDDNLFAEEVMLVIERRHA